MKRHNFLIFKNTYLNTILTRKEQTSLVYLVSSIIGETSNELLEYKSLIKSTYTEIIDIIYKKNQHILGRC